MNVWTAAFLLAIAAPGSESATEPSAVSVSSERQIALKLAETLYPKSTVQSFSTQASVDSLSIEFSREPILIKLEQTYPGLRDAILKRAPDVLDSLVESRLPALYSAMADRLFEDMTEAKLRDALAFVEGPEGQDLMRSGTDHVIKNYLERGPFSPSDVKKLAENVKPVSVQDPRAASWGKAHMVIGPVLRAWVDEQHKDQIQALGEVIDTIISEMVDREPT